MADNDKKQEAKVQAKVQAGATAPEKTKAAPETVQEAAAAAAKATVEALMPAMVAAIRTKQENVPQRQGDTVKRAPVVCSECRQQLGACKGRHREIIIWTHEQRFMDWFDGVDINGVNYISPNRNTPVVVPADAADEILSKVQVYERNEMDSRLGRKALHDSGTIDNPKRATAADGWR